MTPEHKKELYTLLNSLCEGLLSDDQQVRLDEILRSDRQACEIYVDFTSMWSDLRFFQTSLYSLNEDRRFSIQEIIDNPDKISDSAIWKALAIDEKTAPAVDTSESEPKREMIQKVVYEKTPRRINKIGLFVAISSVAALLLLIAIIHFLPIETPRPVASITSGIDAHWFRSNETYKAGTRLWNDGTWYQLNQGVAEVTFDSGASVLVESPSRFQVLSENEMALRGTLTAKVPASAYGFTVNTPSSRVMDLGTEFGLISSVESGTEVHVRKGKVQMIETTSGSRNSSSQLLEAGQGGWTSSSGALSRIDYQKDRFYWEMPSPYVYAVKKTNPLYYWRFEGDLRGILKNEMAPFISNNGLAGTFSFVEGPVIGGEQPNKALRFSGRRDQYVVIYDTPGDYAGTNGLSIALWIYPEVSKIQDVIVHRKKDSATIHTDEITLTEDNRVRFYVFCPPDLPEPWTYEAKVSGYNQVLSNPIPLNQWTHVVATYTDRGRMNLYINGQFEASRKLSGGAQMYPKTDCWYIGSEWQDFERGIVKKLRSFKGSVDEISRYNRELTSEEVRTIYKSADKAG